MFNKFERMSKSWFNPLNIFLWSSLISLFSILINYVIANKDYPNINEISTLLFLFVFFLLGFSLSINIFFNTNNYQIIKEDNEDNLKDSIDSIIIKVNDEQLLQDKNLLFILGIIRKIILYLGASYKDFDFLLKTTKDLKIIDKNKSLFFNLDIIDKNLIIECDYKYNEV